MLSEADWSFGGPEYLRSVAGQWNWEMFDKYLATDVSRFTAAAIPGIGSKHPESTHWVFNYFLNLNLRGQFDSPTRELVGVFLRRLTIAFEEYDLAKARTDEFIERRTDGEQAMRVYVSALHHWEQCVAATWQAIAAVTKPSGQKLFKADDGSVEQRLNHIYNWSKHTEEKLDPDQVPDLGPLAVWLTNEGLQSLKDCVLTWSELAEMLEALALVADRLQDPIGVSSPE